MDSAFPAFYNSKNAEWRADTLHQDKIAVSAPH